jgi:hypothetical protein
MSHQSYLCGYISLRGNASDALSEIAKLPARSEEDSWPFLTRTMFSHSASPEYRVTVIHFAASYKDILGSWAAWSKKFEEILSRLSLMQAKVLIEDEYFGDFIAIWRIEQTGHGVARAKFLREISAYKLQPEFTTLGDFGNVW